MRRSWDAVLDELRGIKRFTWTLVSQEAQVLSVDGQTLVLGFAKPGLVETFTNRGQGAVVREAILRATGVDRTVVATVDRRAPDVVGHPAGPTSAPPGRGGAGAAAGRDTGDREPPPAPEPPDDEEPADPSHGDRVAADGSGEDPRPPDRDTSRGGTDRGGRRTDGAGADADGAALVRRMLGAEVIAEEADGS